MTLDKKLLIGVIILACGASYYISLKYEKILSNRDRVDGGIRIIQEDYRDYEIINMILKSPEYLGDSITIINKKIVSSNHNFQGTIDAVVKNDENMAIINKKMRETNMPELYCLYQLSAFYYKDQLKNESQLKKIIK